MPLLPRHRECKDLFLPDLCAMRTVFMVILIAELAAFVLALAPLELSLVERAERLGMISLFVQWCALLACLALCLARPWLCHMDNRRAGLISYALVLLVVLAVTELAYWLIYAPAYAMSLDWHWHFLTRNMLVAALIAGPVLRYFYVQHQWRQRLEAENEARLQALQSRIRPHFLFNSMNTIASLVHGDPDRAEAAVEDLADLFRASLSDARRRIPLAEELALCRRYLAMEALRLGDRLQVEWHVDTLPGDALLPPLLLQPLLENAVYHGIEPLPEGGRIVITGELDGDRIRIRITNPRPPEGASRRRGNRLALENIRERLRTLHGEKGRLSVEDAETGYTVTVSFPYQREDEDPDRR